MGDFFLRKGAFAASLASIVLMAGCVSRPPPQTHLSTAAPARAVPQCQAPQAKDALIGKWLSIHKRRGVAGQLHILFTLKPDGGMAYAEQIRRGKNPPQGLYETGCWHRDGQFLVVQTTKSNGVPVEASDPIYTNRYRILAEAGKTLSLQHSHGPFRARRMPDDYQLPF